MEKYLFVILTVAASVYAATDEFHQLFVPGRSGQVKDGVRRADCGLQAVRFFEDQQKSARFCGEILCDFDDFLPDIADFTAFFDRCRFDVRRIFRRFGAEK